MPSLPAERIRAPSVSDGSAKQVVNESEPRALATGQNIAQQPSIARRGEPAANRALIGVCEGEDARGRLLNRRKGPVAYALGSEC